MQNNKEWVAKPHGIVKALTPEGLARLGVTVFPFALQDIWGKDAPARYMKAQGLSDEAISSIVEHNDSQSILKK